MSTANFTLNEPPKTDTIPFDSQWLSGEGAGSWFYLSLTINQYEITRYSPEGKIECTGIFKITNDIPFDANISFQFVHLSHCKSITIIQNDKVIKMERISTL